MSQSSSNVVASYTLDEWRLIKQNAAQNLSLPVNNQVEYSIAFIVTLLEARSERWFDTFNVSDEVRFLLGLSEVTATKPAELLIRGDFKGMGFWHKHFFAPKFLVKNILNTIQPESSEFNVSVEKTFESLPPDENLRLNWLIDKYSIGAYQYRSSQKRLTGEWIVYKVFQNKTYFLMIATHIGAKDLYANLYRTCSTEFPFLF